MKMGNETCWNYSRNEGKGRIKENDGGDEFKMRVMEGVNSKGDDGGGKFNYDILQELS
jgi:hypothetical protein